VKETKDGRVQIIYSLPNPEGAPKKNNEIYEVNDKEIFVKTVNSLKEKSVLSSPRKHGMMRLNSGGAGGFFDNPHVKAVATP
jgi:hypothetical protein